MRKSSRLTNGFSLRDINFSGFSTSANWVGYFERNKAFSYSLIDEAVSLFEGFVKSDNKGVVVLTALSFDDDREGDEETIKRYQCVYDEMKSKRLLSPMTDDFESYRYGESPLIASSLSFSLSSADFIGLSKLLMCHAGVIGQVCFYIDPSLNIAIYPHDDTGFGCVALNSDEGACRDFLNYCSGSGNFTVVMNDA